MFAKTYDTIVLYLSAAHDLSIVQMGTVHLECTFAELLEESIALTSLNRFESCWEITPDGSVILDLASWTQIK